MLSTEGLVLKSLKYGDTSLIIHVFTHKYGIVPIMVKGVRKNLKGSANILNPGSYLNCLINYNAQRNFQYFKEYNSAAVFWNTQADITKHCVFIFCIEILGEILVEGDEQPELFDFAIAFFHALDQSKSGTFNNYPFYFLGQIAEFLGYTFDNNYSHQNCFFNIFTGAFESSPSTLQPVVGAEQSQLLHELMQSDLANISNIKVKGVDRQALQDIIIQYLQIHTPYFKKIHSLEVLRAILN